MEIRPVEPRDVDSLQANCYSKTPLEEVADLVRADWLQDGKGVLLVASDAHGEIAGNLTVTRDEHRLRHHRAKVGGFVITGRARGTGLARQLLNGAIDWARGNGCSILEISCRGGTHAEDAYRGLGFVEYGRMAAGYVEDAGVFDEVNLFIRIDR